MKRFNSIRANHYLYLFTIALLTIGCSTSKSGSTSNSENCRLWEFESNETCSKEFDDGSKIYALGSGRMMGDNMEMAYRMAESNARTDLARKVAMFQDRLIVVVEKLVYENSDGTTNEVTITKEEVNVQLNPVLRELRQCNEAESSCYALLSVPKESALSELNTTLKQKGIYELVSTSSEYKDLVAKL